MKDPVIDHIEQALERLDVINTSRENALARTKLEEALLWYQFGTRVTEDRGW